MGEVLEKHDVGGVLEKHDVGEVLEKSDREVLEQHGSGVFSNLCPGSLRFSEKVAVDQLHHCHQYINQSLSHNITIWTFCCCIEGRKTRKSWIELEQCSTKGHSSPMWTYLSCNKYFPA